VALPAIARLHRRLDAAEAGRVPDQTRRALDEAHVAVDVEREQPAEAWIAHALHLRVVLKAADDLGCGLGLAANAQLERLEAAEHEVGGIGRGDDSCARAELA